MDVLDLILECAAIPSFSSFEQEIHPWVESIAKQLPEARVVHIPDNNLFIEVPGKRPGLAVALTAHLDKINHFGEQPQDSLPVDMRDGELIGQLDDSVGVGICMHHLLQSRHMNYPSLYILLSEMEESRGFDEHPHLLRNGGKDMHSGIGAERIAEHLLRNDRVPEIVITIDTTPLFRGSRGIALYSKHWEMNGLSPTEALIEKTARIENVLTDLLPTIELHNNTNDYLEYGRILNHDRAVASVAVEPAISPYHQIGEKVFVEDILKITELLDELLTGDKLLSIL
jgi:hypothetical protein